jgi:hypothetical protein
MVECFRFLPHVPRKRRIAFIHGRGGGLVSVCLAATTIGYGLAANFSQLFAAVILMLTPLAFLFSTARDCRELADGVALARLKLATSRQFGLAPGAASDSVAAT